MDNEYTATSIGRIVELKHRHLPSVYALLRMTHEDHKERFPDLFNAEDTNVDNKLAAHFCPYLKTPFSFKRRTKCAIGYETNEEMLGYLLYVLGPDGHRSGKQSCVITDIAVRPESKQQGIASAMINELLKRISPLEECSIYAHIWEGNTASEALFRGAGFSPLYTLFHQAHKSV